MIVRITGGLGNQMFQFAFYKTLKNRFPKRIISIDKRFYNNINIHSGYELGRVFGIECDYYEGNIKAPSERCKLLYLILYHIRIKKWKTHKYYMEVLLGYFNDALVLNGDNYYYDGYWQSQDYFESIIPEIREIYKFPPLTEPENIALEVYFAKKNSVSLHVRRGDFLSSSKFICLGESCYYQNAIEYIYSRIENPVFIVFSDDIEWCKNKLNLPNDSIFVEWNTGEKSYRDMQLMSLCSNNIIANSSFSWWGAWLNDNPDKIVVAPNKFYKGEKRDESKLIPYKWIKIEV